MQAPITVELDDSELRVAPWRTGSDMALITPLRFAHRLDAELIRRAVDAAAHNGYAGAYTSALNPPESEIFADAGFTLERQLHLLLLDLTRWQRRDNDRDEQSRLARLLPRVRPTRPVLHDRYPELLEIDQAAFDSFWRFDHAALNEAVTATPTVRVGAHMSGVIAGYHITGLAGDQGYIQRLAVHPECQRGGIGRSLLVDSLTWLRRCRARVAHVNTQLDNLRALRLYESEGFVNQPERLSVFAIRFAGTVPDTAATRRYL